MMREQRPADVLVQAVLEVILQVAKASVQNFRFVAAARTINHSFVRFKSDHKGPQRHNKQRTQI